MTPDEYASLATVPMPFCNLCGARGRSADREIPERFGFPARTLRCLECGLLWISPRLSDDAYRTFYETGEYRQQVRDRSTATVEGMLGGQQVYADCLTRFLTPFTNYLKGKTLLDIGGSTGVVAKAMMDAFAMDAVVLEPSASEGHHCESLGVKWISGTVATFTTAVKWDVVFLCQTIEHLTDIAGSLESIRGWLKPDGILFMDIVDVDRQWKATGNPQVKIDHVWYLTPHTMRAFLMRAGFNPLYEARIDSCHKAMFLCDRMQRYAYLPDQVIVRDFLTTSRPRCE